MQLLFALIKSLHSPQSLVSLLRLLKLLHRANLLSQPILDSLLHKRFQIYLDSQPRPSSKLQQPEDHL